MNYKDAVKEKIKDETTKNLWEEIAKSYEQGGKEGIKTVLSKKADEIVTEFKKLLESLEQKL